MIKMTTEDQQDFARTIKEKRMELGWTQERLANEAQIDITTVNRTERGKTKPTHLLREILCKALGLENKWLK